MKYGVRLPVAGPFTSYDGITKIAKEAERLGYDAIYSTDNLLWEPGERIPFYTGSIEAQERKGGPVALYGAISTLAYVAGITSRIQINPDALCLGWRNVIILAREAAALHELSRGRFVLSTCLGRGQNGDYLVTNSLWKERGRVVAEKLHFLSTWINQEGPVSFAGNYLSFENLEIWPQPKGMHLWHAGGSDAVLKRAARYCDGWMPRGVDPKQLRNRIQYLYEEAEHAGRNNVRFDVVTNRAICLAQGDEEAWEICRATFEARGQEPPRPGDKATKSAKARKQCVGSPETVARVLREEEEAGATGVRLGFIGHTLESILEQMEMFAKEVIPLVGK